MTTHRLYTELNSLLKTHHIGINAAELHGFLTGVLAGGNQDQSWQPLLFDMLNDGQAFNNQLLEPTIRLYNETKHQLDEDSFEFQLLLDKVDLFNQINDMVGWVNHFLLGLGLVQPKLAKIEGDVGEAITDLRQITLLGYDEDENQDELAFALEEVIEYVRMSVILCHDEFSKQHISPTIH